MDGWKDGRTGGETDEWQEKIRTKSASQQQFAVIMA